MENGRKNAAREERSGEEAEMAELRTSLDATIKLLQFTRLRNLKDDDNAISLNFRIDTSARDEKKMEEVKRKVGEELTKIDSFLQRHTSLHYPSLLSLHAISDRHKRDLRKMAPTMQQMKDKVRKAQNDVDLRKDALLASLFLRMNSFCREAFLITVNSAQQSVDQLRVTIEELQKKMTFFLPSTPSSSSTYSNLNTSSGSLSSQQASKVDSVGEMTQDDHFETQMETSFEEVSLPDDALGFGLFSSQPGESLLHQGEDHHPTATLSSSHHSGSLEEKETSSASFIPQGLPQGLQPALAESLSRLNQVEEVVALLSKAVRGVKRFLFLQQRGVHLSFLASLLAHASESSNASSDKSAEPSKTGSTSSSTQQKASAFSTSATSPHSQFLSSKDTTSSSNHRDESFYYTSTRVLVLEELEDQIKTNHFPLILDPLSSSLTSILSTLELLESHHSQMSGEDAARAQSSSFVTATASRIKAIMSDILDCYVSIGREGDFSEVVRQRMVEPKFILPILSPSSTSSLGAPQGTHNTYSASVFDPATAISAAASPSAAVQDQPLWKHLFLPFLHWSKHSLAWKIVQETTCQHKRPFLHLLALARTRSSFHTTSTTYIASKSSTLSTQKSLAPLILSPIAMSMVQGEVEGSKETSVMPSTLTTSAAAPSTSAAPSTWASSSAGPSSISPLTSFFLRSSSLPSPPIESYADMASLLLKEASEADREDSSTLQQEGEKENGAHLASSHSSSLLNASSSSSSSSSSRPTSVLEEALFSLRHGVFGSSSIPSSHGSLGSPSSPPSSSSTYSLPLGSPPSSSSTYSLPLSSPQLLSIMTIQSWFDESDAGDQVLDDTGNTEKKGSLASSLAPYTASLSSFLASSPFAPSSSSHQSSNPPSKVSATTTTASVWFSSSSSPSSSSSASLVAMLKSYLIQHRDDERKAMLQSHQALKKEAESESALLAPSPATSSSSHSHPPQSFTPAFFAILSDSDFATVQGMSETALLRFLAFLLVSHSVHSPLASPHAFNLRLPSIMHEGMSLGDWMARDIVWAPFCAALSLASSPIAPSSSSNSSTLSASTPSTASSVNLPSLSKTLFSAGLPPPLLRRNLLLFSQFLSEFEANIAGFRKGAREGALKSIFSLRTHPAANPSSWHHPWNVAGFVSLFTKQIIESFDEAMTRELQNATKGEVFVSSSLHPSSSSSSPHPSSSGYHLGITRALDDCLSRIWTPTAWVESLAHRFLKLSLQSFIHFSSLAIGSFDPMEASSDAWIEKIMTEGATNGSSDTLSKGDSKSSAAAAGAKSSAAAVGADSKSSLAAGADSKSSSRATDPLAKGNLAKGNGSSLLSSSPHTFFLHNLLVLHHQSDLKWHREASEDPKWQLKSPDLVPSNALNVLLLLLEDISLLERKMEAMEAYWSFNKSENPPSSKASPSSTLLAGEGYLLSNVIGPKTGLASPNPSSKASPSSTLLAGEGYLLSNVIGPKTGLASPSPASTISSSSSSSSSSTAVLASMSSKALREGAESTQVLIQTRAASLLPLLLSHLDSFKAFGSQMKEIGQKYRFGGTGVSNPSAPSQHLFSLFSSFLPLFCPLSPQPTDVSNSEKSHFEKSVDWMALMSRIEENTEEKESISLLPRHSLVLTSLTPILASIADTFLVQAKALLHSAQKTQAFLDRKKKTNPPSSNTLAAPAAYSSLLSPTPSPLSSLAPSPSPLSPSLSPIPSTSSLLHFASLPFPSVPSSPLPDHAKLLLQLLWDAHFLAKATLLLGCSTLTDQLSAIFQVLLHDSSASH